MHKDNQDFLTEFERFLGGKGLRLTMQRRQLTEVVMATHEHLTVDELVEKVRQANLPIGRATVYRTVDLLCQAGLMQGHDFGQGTRRYEPTLDHHHHDHMRCTGCGKIIEFECEEIERLQEEMAKKLKFTMHSHRLEIFGLCHNCNKPDARSRR